MPILQQVNNDDLKHPGDDPNVTDPQENEKEGNVFGKVFDAIFGDYKGDNSLSQGEPKSPAKTEGEEVVDEEVPKTPIPPAERPNDVTI